MSELQPDDPEPLPSTQEYPVNYQTGLAYDDVELTADLAEREAIYYLSEAAKAILDIYGGEGSAGARHAYIEGAELHRIVNRSGVSVFGFIDTIDGHSRCRAWVDNGNGVNWCDEELRYEPAKEVMERLIRLFPTEQASEQESRLIDNVINGGLRLRRALAMAVLR